MGLIVQHLDPVWISLWFVDSGIDCFGISFSILCLKVSRKNKKNMPPWSCPNRPADIKKNKTPEDYMIKTGY
ncbi:MAG: hypothetical protein CSA23_07235 [Deltaproteobacteria bacterium]|nr:MAG: hypothetical protein CSA23_07235 [Deltaproteobacteria bacterium]